MEMITLAGVQYKVKENTLTPLIKETDFEKKGGTYMKQGEMLIPNLKVDKEIESPIGIYGRARKRFLEENKAAQHSAMIIEGELQTHLIEVQSQAQKLLDLETPRMMEAWEVTETLKATDPMKWVGLMNNIKSSIEEKIYSEIVYL